MDWQTVAPLLTANGGRQAFARRPLFLQNEAFYAEAEQKAEAAFAESQAKPEETAWDLSDISDGWGEDKSGFSGKSGKF